MTTRQENINIIVVRTLEMWCATFFAIVGFALTACTINLLCYSIGDLLWRVPRGQSYLHWDMLTIQWLFVLSAATFSAVAIILARAFWLVRWSRRSVILVILLAIIGFCLFIVSMIMLGAGLSQID